MRGIKRILGIAVTLAMLMSMVVVPASVKAADDNLWTAEGNYDYSWYNDEETEFEISSAKELAGLAAYYWNNCYSSSAGTATTCFEGKIFKLSADIDLSAHKWDLFGYTPSFAGTIDGQGHTIKGMNVSSNYGGFIGVAKNATIKNLTIEAEVTGAYCGGFIGYALEGNQLENCHFIGTITDSGRGYNGGLIGYANGKSAITYSSVEGTVTGSSFVGGLVGRIYGNVTITDCMNRAAINGSGGNIGGIVGRMNGGLLNHCANFGAVRANNPTGFRDDGGLSSGTIVTIAGIVGDNWSGTIINSNNYGDVTVTGGENIQSYYAGGITTTNAWAYTNPRIINCYNSGEISLDENAESYAGGIAAVNGNYSEIGHIENCYNKGIIHAKNIGGITGITRTKTIKDSYYTKEYQPTIESHCGASADGVAIPVFEFGGYVETKDSNVVYAQKGSDREEDTGETYEGNLEEQLNKNRDSLNESYGSERYLPWTKSDKDSNNSYPVFAYPITVMYKYEGESDYVKDIDHSVVNISNLLDSGIAYAASKDTIFVDAAKEGEEYVKGSLKVVDKYKNDIEVKLGNTFTMPAFDTTIYVTLKKNEEWISALVYDFPQETINNVTYDKIMLATGSDKASGITFEATIIGNFTYAPTATEYRRNGSIVADTYYDEATGDYGEESHQAKLNVKEYFGKDYLSTVTFLVPAGETTTIEFNPTDGTNDGIRYRWSAGEKEYLTSVNEDNGGE